MVDFDGVVCNEKYQVTTEVKSYVARLVSNDVAIVPNSDTPFVRLRNDCMRMLGVEPQMVIAERGAIVQMGNRVVFTKRVDGIPELREKICSALRKLGLLVYVGDSVSWVRDGKVFDPGSDIVLVDELREQTLSLYFKSTDERGQIKMPGEWAEQAMEHLRESNFAFPAELLPLDYNPAYGIAISNVAMISKADGAAVLNAEFPGIPLFMIGDSNSDIVGNNVVHCAVANASRSLKEKANFISARPYTEGLVEILSWISTQ